MSAALDNVLSRLQGVKESNGQRQALCPAHPDSKPSLSVSEGKDGRVLLKCFAGCSTEDIVGAMGLKVHDLFPPKHAANPPSCIVATYDYTDAAGKLLYQAVRYEPKSFKFRRPSGKGGWTWDLDGVRRVLYRLPRVKKAVSRGETVFVAEGEEDVHSLESIGLTGTCNPGGAGNWCDRYSRQLAGADVMILPDNDGPGKDHAAKVAESAHEVAASTKVVALPGLPQKGDVSDWLKAGHTKDELLRLVESAQEWTPKDQNMSATGTFSRADMGNAERLIHHFGEDLRFVPDWKRWIVWDGVRWAQDRSLQIECRAKETVRRIYGEAEATEREKERESVANWALRSESSERIAAMIRLAQSEVALTADKLDLNPYLLACENGVLDLQTGALLGPCRQNYITKQVPIAYHPDAECPTWHGFLEKVLPDAEVRDYVQKGVGYTLTGDVSEQCLFFLFGEGKNGKTTFIETISALMGDYFTKTRSDTLMLRRNIGIPNEVAALAGSRLVTVSEISSGQKLDEGLVKDLSGGDTLSARFLYGETFNFKAGFKLWMYGNHKPTIRGKDEGIWRRIRLIPFPVVIPTEERDGHLPDKLRGELPGILAWAVQGCSLCQKDGLREPKSIQDAVNEYRREQDALADFLAECCTIDRRATVTKKELWTAYMEWADTTGEECFETQRMFNAEIRNRPGVKEGRGTGNAAVWKGIGLR